MQFNRCQTPIEDLNLQSYPKEVIEQFLDFINNVPFIKWMVSPDRPLISELPRDSEGKAIIDVTKPPILEGTDYFRQSGLTWQETGKYTPLRPNRNPNSDFGRWLLEEMRRGWEGYLNPDTGMWVTGDYYWMLNYCPMHLIVKRKDGLEMRTTKHPKFWDGQFLISHYILQSRMNGHHSAYLASRGKGKAHPYSQIVYTPDGARKWGDIKIGDELFGDDGNLTKVTDIPFDAEESIYTVTLADGRKLKCTSGHLFYVKDNRKRPSMRVVSLYDIMHSDYAHKRKDGGIEYYYSIPNNKKVEFKAQDVFIDPYTLGLLIGDGCLTKSSPNVAEMTSGEEDFEFYKQHIPYEMYSRKGKYSHGIKINNIQGYLEEYNLWNTTSSEKFIPKEYLFNTSDVRMAILQGIMDTDGTVNNNGIPMLTTTSKRLARDIRWLCNSLGYNSRMFTKQGKYRDDKGEHLCKLTYNVSILTNDPIFKLKRKLEKLTDFKSSYSRSRRDWTRIVDIKYSHKEKAKCVLVDNKSHCYLIGDFIVTHNTSYAAAMLAKRFILGESKENQKEVQCLVTAADRTKLIGTNQILDVFIDYIDFCAKNTFFPSRRLKSSIQEMYWEMGWKNSGSEVAYGSKNSVSGIISGVNQDKLNGSRGVLYLVEEAGIFKNLREMYNMIRPSVEQGTSVFGQIACYGCVCAGTKVLDENGVIRNIEDIQLGDKLLGYDGNGVSTEDITYIQEEAYKECVRITTSKGGLLECSTDHPLLTLIKKRGYKYTSCGFYKAEELEPGMTLLMPKTINRFGNVHEKDAFLLGALFGDGNYSNHSCASLSISTEEEYNFYNSNYDIGISKLSKSDNTYAQIYFKKMHPLLQKYKMDKQSFDKKKLPYNIDFWDKESLCEFLSGYFNADGNVQVNQQKHRSIKLSCKYRCIVEQVCHLLHKLGITAHILREDKPERILHSKVNNENYKMSSSTLYVLYICTAKDIITFRDNMHFLIKEKQERLDSYVAPSRPEGYYDSLDFIFRENKKGKFFIGKQMKDLKAVTIKSIEPLGKKKIYNLTANTTHTYITNGFISSNTAGNDQSDFTAFSEMFYSPDGYNLNALPNVFDKEGQGRKSACMFYPAYMNYDDSCMDENGNSNVTKALLKLCYDRYKVKYGTTDLNTLTRRISQYPITPQEAIIRSQGNVFPVTELNERLNQIDNNPGEYDEVYIGELTQEGGEVKFVPNVDLPIRDFPTKDNKIKGALEIFEMPQKDPQGKIPTERYIVSCLKEGELVSTEKGLKPVEKVTLEDKLINIDGNPVTIINLQKYYNKDSVYKVKLRNIYNTTTFSKDHPIYCATPKVKYHHSSVVKRSKKPYRYLVYDFDFKKVEYLQRGDVVKSPNIYRKEIPIGDYWTDNNRIDRKISSPLDNKDFWWLIGLILGDGWACKDGYNVHISFNAKEVCYIERAKRIVNKLFNREFTLCRSRKTVVEYSICSQSLNQFITSNIGIGAKNKHLSEWIKYIPHEFKRQLLLGYLASDGCVTNNQLEYVSVSLKLLNDIQDILISLGIPCGVSKMKRYNTVKIAGNPVYNFEDKYHLRVSKLHTGIIQQWCAEDMKLKKYDWKAKMVCHDVKNMWFSDDLKYIYIKVDSVTTEDYVGAVYNYACETHTFMCGYIPTHNCDPFDSDVANTLSLGSCLVLDTWTDKLVAEYTGRPMFAEDLYELVRKICLFYNAKCLYESNIKGTFAYFSAHSCTHLLADTPEYLREKQLISSIGYGNKAKGVHATVPIIKYGFRLIRDWLLKPVQKIEKDAEGREIEVSVPNLYNIKNRALLKELIQWNPNGNFDRVMSLVQLMLYREEKMILFQGDMKKRNTPSSGMERDDYWDKNYPGKKKFNQTMPMDEEGLIWTNKDIINSNMWQ